MTPEWGAPEGRASKPPHKPITQRAIFWGALFVIVGIFVLIGLAILTPNQNSCPDDQVPVAYGSGCVEEETQRPYQMDDDEDFDEDDD